MYYGTLNKILNLTFDKQTVTSRIQELIIWFLECEMFLTPGQLWSFVIYSQVEIYLRIITEPVPFVIMTLVESLNSY